MAEAELKYIKNSGLFSRHYLQNILPKRDIWKDTQKAESVFNKIKSLFNDNKVFLSNSPNEAQLRDKVLNDILEILGHYYQVEGKVEKSAKHPDYGLFEDEESSQEAIALQGKEDFYKKAIAICEAKGWEVSLDKNVKGKPTFANQNPSFQVDAYLREIAPRWAILTNGRYWRLYYQETSYRLENYFEIDLGEIIDKGCLEEFKYFYLLFRREAFILDPQGFCSLDDVYNESISYAKELGENVQENVYKAMKTLAEGFISFSENKLSLTDDEKINDKILREVQENTMKLLYRLLFIFYAEAGGLLDIENRSYKDSYSLDSLKRIIRDQITRGHTISQYTTIHWTKLQDLFRLIDKGLKIPEDNLFIPAYNGGLFDPKRNKFLKEKRVGDYFVANAIDLLATSKSKDDSEKGFVDYSSLDIRHLGAIYEGLLEYKLKRAKEPMVAIRKSKKEFWMPESEFKGRKYVERVDVGGLHLATDKGERKATGSYYTPDYIVKYIVKNTVGPIIEKKIKQAKKEGKSICEAILSTKILDPAMGSGHFLVEVVDFLTQPFLDAVSKDIERGIIEEKEVTAEWAKREIAAHCIYGVDLNPMAVELAKVSLWLRTIAKDKPLSFLDHRLKFGNSLIGVNLGELRNYPDLKKKKKEIAKDQQQFEVVIPQIFIDRLLKKTREIESIRDESLEDTKRKEEIFAELKKTDAYIKTLAIANVNTAVYFGNEVGATSTKDKKGVYYQLISTLDFPKDWQWLSKKDWFIKAQKIAEEKRFFHWELKFPEIFFEKGKRKDNPGFDAVIGNPPWDVLEARITHFIDNSDYLNFQARVELDVNYFRSCGYNYSLGRKLNLFRLFIEKGYDLLREKANFGFIVPSSLLADVSSRGIRKLLFTKSKLSNMIEIPKHIKVFGDVTQACTIFNYMKSHRGSHTFNLATGVEGEKDMQSLGFVQVCIDDIVLISGEFLFIPLIKTDKELAILRRIHRFPKLSAFLEVYQGEVNIHTHRAYIQSHETGNLLVRGEHVHRYYTNTSKTKTDRRWLDKSGFIIASAGDKSMHHTKERIVQQGITGLSDERRFHTSLCPIGSFCGHSTNYYLSKEDIYSPLFFIALLNSKLLEWRFRLTSTNNNLNSYEMEKLPIRNISFTTNKGERDRLFKNTVGVYQAKRNLALIKFVEECLQKDEEDNFITEKEKSDVVHDILAFLAEQIIEMNKRKHKEIKGFLDWIERQIGVHIEDLSLKTYLKEYDEHDFNDLLRVMRQNQNKIQPNLDSREFQETLKKEFDASMTKLKPLKEKIEKTDHLIDQIVYKLYGLTDEEVKIVEESLSKKEKSSLQNKNEG